MQYSIMGALPNPLTSEDKYRYRLWRVWNELRPTVCWVLLNPSTANATEDDPTLRKVVGFSAQWGFGAAVVVNLFAWRSTDPKGIPAMGDVAVGPENNEHIRAAVAECGVAVVVGWGSERMRGRDRAVRKLLPERVYAVKLNADGSPQHPLYVPYSSPLVLYTGTQR